MALKELWLEWTACCVTPDEAGKPTLEEGNLVEKPVSELQAVEGGGYYLEDDDLEEVDIPKDEEVTFRVTVKRRRKTGLGLHLDITEGAHVLIAGIIDNGPVWAYNKTVREALQIRPGDYLVTVNDTPGTPEELVERLQLKRGQHGDLMMEVSRAELWEVRLEKKEEDVFGMDLFASEKTQALVVLDVKCGLIADFNFEHPTMAIRRGDRILSINCSEPGSSDEMMQLLQKSHEVNFLMSRPRVAL